MTPFAPKNILLMPNAAVQKASVLAERISACLKTHAVEHSIFYYDYEHPTQGPQIEGFLDEAVAAAADDPAGLAV